MEGPTDNENYPRCAKVARGADSACARSSSRRGEVVWRTKSALKTRAQVWNMHLLR